MRNPDQLSFADAMIFSRRHKQSRVVNKLAIIDKFVNWDKLKKDVSVIDKTGTRKGGRPRIPIKWMLKILFIQYLYNLSDPELEDQMIDRFSFQKFVGMNLSNEIPDFSTLWRFKESLICYKLLDKMFDNITMRLEGHNLILKKGTVVDATIIKSKNKPLSKEKRKKLEASPSKQIDTDANSTEKNGKKYFGYKGHIGVDYGSKLIRKRRFTSASVHDINEKDNLFSGDEQSKFGDKAYCKTSHKQTDRANGIYHGILDKAKRGSKLSNKQKKRNKQLSKVRAVVEHPFAYMKTILNYDLAMATTKVRNQLRFDMNCIMYNILRGNYLLQSVPGG
ncbi:MAG: IS5 family transposase [Cytophagales bacterium]|nr:IS5 family transposase [Cytophagales bacterium]